MKATVTVFKKTEVRMRGLYGEQNHEPAFDCEVLVIRDIRSTSSTKGTLTETSYGRGLQQKHDARLLFPEDTEIELDDRVDFRGRRLRIVSLEVMLGLRGRAGHIAAELEPWV